MRLGGKRLYLPRQLNGTIFLGSISQYSPGWLGLYVEQAGLKLIFLPLSPELGEYRYVLATWL